MGYKSKRWKKILFSGGVFCALSVLGFAVYENHRLQEYRKKVIILEQQLNDWRREVYVAAEKLTKGTVLTEEKVYSAVRYSDCCQEKFITQAQLGLTVAQDIAEGTCLKTEMFYSALDDVREVFVDVAELPEHIQTGDRVDVRIRYNNAEEYVVISDKAVVKCESGKGMILRLTEEEILLLSSAVSDSEIYSNTRLYAVEYPEFEQLEPGNVTYIANREILSQLGREKTEGENRSALELRLLQKQK